MVKPNIPFAFVEPWRDRHADLSVLKVDELNPKRRRFL
jgi:hypothetical protein